MFLTSLQDKVKRIQELRRSNAAQPVRNKKTLEICVSISKCQSSLL